jgi:glycogen debranching enzyme
MHTANLANNKLGFFLSNNLGGYSLVYEEDFTSYQGFYFYKNSKMYKVIDSLRINQNNEKVEQIIQKLFEVEIKRTTFSEKYFMPLKFNGFIYTAEKKVNIDLLLDCHESYDSRIWGKFYSVDDFGDKLLIKFTKKTDHREDMSDGEEEYSIYICISKLNLDYELINNWEEVFYPYDSRRENREIKKSLCNLLKLSGNKLYITYGHIKNKVIRDNNLLVNEEDRFIKEKKNEILKLSNNINCMDERINTAYLSSKNTVNQLIVEQDNTPIFNQGIFAGLPWFFQFWARDELISFKGIVESGNIRCAINIIKKYSDSFLSDGKLPNRVPHSELGSADSVGWFFFRIKYFLDELENYSNKDDFFNEKHMKQLNNNLELSLNRLLQNYHKNGLIFNNKKETWMDTSIDDKDTREGYRIEIQALYLHMLDYVYKITKNFKYKRLFDDLKKNVRLNFFKDGILYDGMNDPTIRPNIFLACYIFPDLLTNEEWTLVFKNSLPKLWLDWGGLATIDKDNPLYCETYTGQNNLSYHRGDSWFFINNITSIVLHRINNDEFIDYIHKIIQASTKEIIELGVIGAHSEVSSAKELESAGSMIQAWSSATYVEMINEIYK